VECFVFNATLFRVRRPNSFPIALANLSGQHTMAKIAEHFGVHYATVGRLVKVYEEAQR
jgi:hypothetical protein